MLCSAISGLFLIADWGCVTAKVLASIREFNAEASDLDGYSDLRDEDQARIDYAYEHNAINPADVPESAKKPEGEADEEKPKKKAAPKKKVRREWLSLSLLSTHLHHEQKADADDDAEEKKPAPKKRGPKKKVSGLVAWYC